MALEVLARNWWMMAARGGLAAVFGLTLLAWPGVTLSVVVVLFGVYAMLDGLLAVIAAVSVRNGSIGRLAVAAEGLVSLGLGWLALAWPFVSRDFIQLVAGWGVLTGILEIVTAASLPRERVGHWLMGTAGVSSLFLAVLVLMVPEADVARVVYVIGGYALLFGVVVTRAAFWFRGAHRSAAAAPAYRRAA